MNVRWLNRRELIGLTVGIALVAVNDSHAGLPGDTNRDGHVDIAEVQRVINSFLGLVADDPNINSSTVYRTLAMPSGTEPCLTGGTAIEVGLDLNGNKSLDDNEVKNSAYVCNGLTGADGAQGVAGPKGDKGDIGPQGLQGPVGPQGDKGDAGPQGLQGPVGPKGDRGDVGPQGFQGPVGPKGDTGSQGPQGIQGPAGIITKDALCALYNSENAAPPAFCRKTMFLSSRTWPNANLGGLSGADSACQQLATNAGLAGTYKAWLSSSNSSASARMSHSTLPYYTPGGKLVAKSWQDLTTGNLANGVTVYEDGTALPALKMYQTIVLTGTNYNGSSEGDNCLDWTNSTNYPYSAYGGYSGQTGTSWSGTGYWDCANTNTRDYAVYCIQQ